MHYTIEPRFRDELIEDEKNRQPSYYSLYEHKKGRIVVICSHEKVSLIRKTCKRLGVIPHENFE